MIYKMEVVGIKLLNGMWLIKEVAVRDDINSPFFLPELGSTIRPVGTTKSGRLLFEQVSISIF